MGAAALASCTESARRPLRPGLGELSLRRTGAGAIGACLAPASGRPVHAHGAVLSIGGRGSFLKPEMPEM